MHLYGTIRKTTPKPPRFSGRGLWASESPEVINSRNDWLFDLQTVCGSLGTLLKARVQSQSGSTSDQSTASGQQQEAEEPPMAEEEADAEHESDVKPRPVTARKVDLNAKVESHLDKLDSLMKKAENAQYSMKHQTSQMKQFFK
jgi:small-conductance mechanosensitive channel